MTEPLTDDEKRKLRESAFIRALHRVSMAARISAMIHSARNTANELSVEDSRYRDLENALAALLSKVPNEQDALLRAVGINAESYDYFRGYDDLRARFNGEEIADDECYMPEHPARVVEKVGGLRSLVEPKVCRKCRERPATGNLMSVSASLCTECTEDFVAYLKKHEWTP